MSKKIKVSVIVPVYNVENYLKECLDSLRDQTLKSDEIEIILVNDGSTDGSGKICEKYAAKYKNFYVYHKKNGGLSEARNYGIQRAKGEYLMFIDSDDKIEPNSLELMYNSCIKNRTKLAICNFKLWFSKTNYTESVRDLRNTDKLQYNPLDLNGGWHNMACRKIYHKDIFKKILFPVGIYHEDIGFWYACMALTNKISYIEECLYAYRRDNSNSISVTSHNQEVRKMHFLKSFQFGIDQIKLLAPKERQQCLLTALLDGFIRLYWPSNKKDWKEQNKKILNQLYAYKEYLPHDTQVQYWNMIFPDLKKLKEKFYILYYPFKFVFKYLVTLLSFIKYSIRFLIKVIKYVFEKTN